MLRGTFPLDSCRAGLVTSQGFLRPVPHSSCPDPEGLVWDQCSLSAPCREKDLVLGLMSCCHHLQSLNLSRGPYIFLSSGS